MKLIQLNKIGSGAKNAAVMGIICSIAYMTVYFARNILSVATPEMLNSGYTTEYIGVLSTAFMIAYAIGQLVNGIIGDYIKSKYMISVGLLAAAVCNLVFLFTGSDVLRAVFYGLGGFCLSMVYAPMTKAVAENIEYRYVTAILLGLAIAAYIASPLAGLAAIVLNWKALFVFGQVLLILSAVMCYILFAVFEKKGIIKYEKNTADEKTDEKNGKLSVLLGRGIIQYSFISVFTGIMRTSVVFWIPTMLVQYMNYSEKSAVGIFSAVSTVTSFSPYIGIWCYHFFFKKDIEKTMFSSFAVGAVCFFLMCVLKNPAVNVVLLAAALIGGNIASSMLWNVYCPSLKDTGMVSGATGYLDFISYIGGAIANILFSNAAVILGWKILLIIWGIIMIFGAAAGLPWNKLLEKRRVGEKR